MEIIETSVFTRLVQNLLTDDEYRQLQGLLIDYPDRGAVVPGSGGIRKLRWGMRGTGKRGGLRIIYYWAVSDDQLLMLYMYPKNEQEDLTAEQLRRLRTFVEENYP